MKIDLLRLFEKMLVIREAELLIQKHYFNNSMKTPVHLAIGAEAIPCGVLAHFETRRVFGTYRNHHWYLETTHDLESFFLELFGKQKSPSQGRAGSMHLCHPEKGLILTSSVVATTIPVALGDCWAGLQMKQPGQTIVFFGDGAIEEGVFWETLNFARLKNIPLLFVCEDNDLAIHSKKHQRQAFELKAAVESYGVPFFSSSATDVENVFNITAEAQTKLVNGPVFLHLEYFRSLEHVGVGEDFQFQYRTRPDNLATAQDPIWTCRQKLSAHGYPETEILQIEEKVRRETENIFKRCEKETDSDPGLIDLHVFRENS